MLWGGDPWIYVISECFHANVSAAITEASCVSLADGRRGNGGVRLPIRGTGLMWTPVYAQGTSNVRIQHRLSWEQGVSVCVCVCVCVPLYMWNLSESSMSSLAGALKESVCWSALINPTHSQRWGRPSVHGRLIAELCHDRIHWAQWFVKSRVPPIINNHAERGGLAWRLGF